MPLRVVSSPDDDGCAQLVQGCVVKEAGGALEKEKREWVILGSLLNGGCNV